jgi:predicted nucleic acid-binding protein
MQEKVYVDTSSLIILNKINALHLLKKIYGNVIITTQIKSELNEPIPSWIIVETTNETELSLLNQYKLGTGESSIITNALKINRS